MNMQQEERIDEGEGGWLLPQPITQHILSYLSAKDAARTSLVSRDLYSAWYTNPILNLDFDEIDQEQKPFDIRLSDSRPVIMDENRQEFVNFAVKSIHRYHNQQVCIQQLHLSIRCFYWPISTYFIEELFDKIEKTGPLIKEVHVSYTSCGPKNNLLPQLFRFLQVKALKVLNVNDECGLHVEHFCPLKRDFYNREIKCCLLRRLVLEEVYMDDATLECLISRCPLLETLKLLCQYLARIKVANLACLKECVIDNRYYDHGDSEIEIEAPSLESLYCRNISKKFELHYPFPNLKKLSLHDLEIEDSFFQNLADKFPNLEDLIVECYGYKKVNISSNSLKSLSFPRGSEEDEVNISAPGLVSFQYVGNRIPQFHSFPTKCKCDIIFYLDMKTVDSLWFFQLKKTLSQLIHSTVSLAIYFLELDYVERLSNSPIFGDIEPEVQVEDLNIDIYDCLRKCPSLYSTLVDNFFWCCRPKTVCIFWLVSDHNDREFSKYLCSRLMDRKNPDNGNSGEYKYSSWENDLKEVQIQTFDLEEDEKKEQPLPVDWRILVSQSPPVNPMESFIRLKWHKKAQVDTSSL